MDQLWSICFFLTLTNMIIKDLNVDYKKIQEEKIYGYDCDIIQIINEVLHKVYPGNYEMHISYSGINIYIYFPKLTLTNKNKKEHTIYDTIVCVKFECHKLTNIKGIRTSFSLNEIYSRYTHSHLSICPTDHYFFNKQTEAKYISDYLISNDFQRYYKDVKSIMYNFGGTFCLGSGGINKLIMIINGNDKNKKDSNIWTLFFRNVKTYLEYESLEGGPYKKMQYIGSNNSITGLSYSDLLNCFDSRSKRIYEFLINKHFKEISNYISENSDEFNFFIDGNGNLQWFHNLESEVLLYDVVKFLTYTSDRSHISFIRTVYNNVGYYTQSINQTKFTSDYYNVFEELEKKKFIIGNNEIAFRVIDKEKLLINSDDNDVIRVLNPVLVNLILNKYVSYQGRKKSIIDFNQGRKKSVCLDF